MRALPLAATLALNLAWPGHTEELSSGPWRVAYTPGGIQEVAYADEAILTRSTLIVFQPNYGGHQFAMGDGRVSRRDEGDVKVIEWSKAEPGKASVTLTHRLGTDWLEWHADR